MDIRAPVLGENLIAEVQRGLVGGAGRAAPGFKRRLLSVDLPLDFEEVLLLAVGYGVQGRG